MRNFIAALLLAIAVTVVATVLLVPDKTKDDSSSLPACGDLVGTPTSEVQANAQCEPEDGGVELLGFMSYNCTDGREIIWNDRGWGYTNSSWQAHTREDGQLVPPQADLDTCLT